MSSSPAADASFMDLLKRTQPVAANSQLATNYYNKGEVDGLIAGVSGGGGGVSNPIELVDANTSIERYTNATKSNV